VASQTPDGIRLQQWLHSTLMKDLLDYADSNYYRKTRLNIVRAELEQFRDRELWADLERPSKIPLGQLQSTNAMTVSPSRR